MQILTNSNGEMYVQLETNPLTDRLDELIEFYGGSEALALAIEREWHGYDHSSERDGGPEVIDPHANEIKDRKYFFYRAKATSKRFLRPHRFYIRKKGRVGDY